jgi:hypothetical protein
MVFVRNIEGLYETSNKQAVLPRLSYEIGSISSKFVSISLISVHLDRQVLHIEVRVYLLAAFSIVQGRRNSVETLQNESMGVGFDDVRLPDNHSRLKRGS